MYVIYPNDDCKKYLKKEHLKLNYNFIIEDLENYVKKLDTIENKIMNLSK